MYTSIQIFISYMYNTFPCNIKKFIIYYSGTRSTRKNMSCEGLQKTYQILPGDVDSLSTLTYPDLLFWQTNCNDIWGKLWITVDSGSYKINFSINPIAKGNNMLRQYPSFSAYERAIKDGVGGLEIRYWTSAKINDYFWLRNEPKNNFFTLTYNGDPKKLIVAGTVGDNNSIIPFNLNVDKVLADKQILEDKKLLAVPVVVDCKDFAKSKGIVPGISNGNATEIDLVEFDKKCNSWAITTYNNFKEKPVEQNKISATPIIPGSTTRERREDWECNWYFEVNPSRTPPKCYETTVKQDTFCAEMANYLDITATDCGALPEVWGENWNKVCVNNQCPNALNNLSCDALQKKYRIFPNDFGTLPKSAVYIWNQKCNAFWGSLKIYRYNGNYTVTCVINPAIQDNNNILRVYATYQDFLRAINEQIGLDIYWAKINTTSSTLSLNLENKDYFFTLSYKGQPNVLIASGFPTYPDPYSVANKYITVDITNNSFKINFNITQIRGYNSFSVATFNLIRVIDGKYLLRETAPTLGTRSYSFDNVYSGKYTAALEIIMGMDVDKSYVEFQIAGDATLLEKERMAREQSELDYFQTHTCELNRIHFGINMNSFGTLPSSKHGEWRQKCGDMFGWTGCWTCKS